MSILRKAGTAAAISVAGAGIAVGGIGLAAADDGTSAQDSTAQTESLAADGTTATSAPSGGGRAGLGRGDRRGSGELASGLAEALGLQESEVGAALESLRDELRPAAPVEGETRTPPTEDEREARRAEMASALADELGVSEQKVTTALDSLASDRTAEARSGLADRLDTAVSDGSLTQADKQAVLKAFDAGVLGGARRDFNGARGADEGSETS